MEEDDMVMRVGNSLVQRDEPIRKEGLQARVRDKISLTK